MGNLLALYVFTGQCYYCVQFYAFQLNFNLPVPRVVFEKFIFLTKYKVLFFYIWDSQTLKILGVPPPTKKRDRKVAAAANAHFFCPSTLHNNFVCKFVWGRKSLYAFITPVLL